MQINDVLTEFENACIESESVILEVSSPAYDVDVNKQLVRQYAISYAFLKFFTSWERFLENSFISYSLGELSLNGNAAPKYINPVDEQHAVKIFKGLLLYPDWTSVDNIITLAENFFVNGEPYKSHISTIQSHFKNAKTIRNAIGHNSQKSIEAFNSLVRNTYSVQYVGISVSEYLRSRKTIRRQPFYKEYFDFLLNAARNISSI